MNHENFRITISSLPDREHLVAEILYDGVQWAEISQESEMLRLELYPHPQRKDWEFPFDEAFEILEKAKAKLLN